MTGLDTNDLIVVDPKMIFEVSNRYITTSGIREQACVQAIDQAIESINQAEDVERILPLLRQNLMDDDVRCTYLSAKALQDLIKNDRYLPSLMKHQPFWQGKIP